MKIILFIILFTASISLYSLENSDCQEFYKEGDRITSLRFPLKSESGYIYMSKFYENSDGSRTLNIETNSTDYTKYINQTKLTVEIILTNGYSIVLNDNSSGRNFNHTINKTDIITEFNNLLKQNNIRTLIFSGVDKLSDTLDLDNDFSNRYSSIYYCFTKFDSKKEFTCELDKVVKDGKTEKHSPPIILKYKNDEIRILFRDTGEMKVMYTHLNSMNINKASIILNPSSKDFIIMDNSVYDTKMNASILDKSNYKDDFFNKILTTDINEIGIYFNEKKQFVYPLTELEAKLITCYLRAIAKE